VSTIFKFMESTGKTSFKGIRAVCTCLMLLDTLRAVQLSVLYIVANNFVFPLAVYKLSVCGILLSLFNKNAR